MTISTLPLPRKTKHLSFPCFLGRHDSTSEPNAQVRNAISSLCTLLTQGHTCLLPSIAEIHSFLCGPVPSRPSEPSLFLLVWYHSLLADLFPRWPPFKQHSPNAAPGCRLTISPLVPPPPVILQRLAAPLTVNTKHHVPLTTTPASWPSLSPLSHTRTPLPFAWLTLPYPLELSISSGKSGLRPLSRAVCGLMESHSFSSPF